MGSMGDIYGFRQLSGGGSRAVLGNLDPAEFNVLGATFRVIRAEHNRETGEVLFAITSCPSSLEMASFEMDGTPMTSSMGGVPVPAMWRHGHRRASPTM